MLAPEDWAPPADHVARGMALILNEGVTADRCGYIECQALGKAAEADRRAALVEVATFDTTRFPAMEAEAARQAGRLGVNPLDLLLACEDIFRAGLKEAFSGDAAENGYPCRCGHGGFGCCEDT